MTLAKQKQVHNLLWKQVC